MQIRIFSIFSVILISCAVNFAQTISIDLDSSSGIQSTFISKDTAVTIGVAIRLTGVSQISSYQFKVAFDTSRFSFVGAQQDFGITGEKNILTKNSGSIIGIAQLQLNPLAKDTVEFSYTLTGTTVSTLVSGDGLAGVLYLKSKVPMGDSSAITASNCILADFEQNQTIVNSYNKGTYLVLPVTWNVKHYQSNSNNHESLSPVSLSTQHNCIRFDIPSSILKNTAMVSFNFYTLDGKFLTEFNTPSANNNFYTIRNNDYKFFKNSGSYLCRLKMGNRSYTQIVSFN